VPADGVIFLAAGKPTTLRLEAPAHKGTVVQVEGVAGETRHVSVDMPLVPPPPSTAPPPVARSSEPAVTSSAQAASAEPSAPPAAATPAATTPTESGPTQPGHGLRVAGIVVASVGVAAGIAGGVLLAQAGSKHDALQADIINNNRPSMVTNDAYVSRNDSWKSEQTLGIACAVGGGVALVGGAILYLVGRQGHAEEGAKVSFISGSGFGLLSYGGSF
jgi:hypothetical protein